MQQPAGPNILQSVNQAHELACLARRERLGIALQVVSSVNAAVLTGTAAVHLYRDIKRAERESNRSR